MLTEGRGRWKRLGKGGVTSHLAHSDTVVSGKTSPSNASTLHIPGAPLISDRTNTSGLQAFPPNTSEVIVSPFCDWLPTRQGLGLAQNPGSWILLGQDPAVLLAPAGQSYPHSSSFICECQMGTHVSSQAGIRPRS